MISIVGGGPAGRIAERIFQLKQWDCTLFTPPSQNASNKLILLNAPSMQFLQALGFDIPYQHTYTSLKVLQHRSFHHLSIHADTYRAPALCYAIQAADLQQALEQHSNPIHATIDGGAVTPHGFDLATSQGAISTQYLVGCDGGQSVTKRIAHINTTSQSLQHSILIPAQIEGNTLIQRYSKHFIMAAIPGENGMIILSYSTPPPMDQLSQAFLQSYLKHHCYIQSIGTPKHYTYRPQIASTCFQKGALLLGNAALVVAPVAAQGLNHAISNLKLLYHMPHWEQKTLHSTARQMQHNNKRLYRQMDYITRTGPISTLIKKVLFSTQLFSPLLQDWVYTFGNRYE